MPLPDGRGSVRGVALILILIGAAVLARAELAEWVQHIPSPSQLQAVFFRTTPTAILRPPKETRAALGRLIATSPSAELYALRAREDEQQLDFTAAEAGWKEHLRLATDKPQAQLDLADFYHRRIRPRDEIAALQAVGQAASERLTPPSKQRAWHAFERILSVVSEQALPTDVAETTYRAWISRYPKEPSLYRKFLDYLESHARLDQAAQLIADYSKAFPDDAIFRVEATATLAWRRGSIDQAAGIYDQSFRPLWPPELVKGYFDLLKQTHALRRYLELARAQIAAKPTDLVPATRVFYYYQQQGNLAASQRALLEYRSRKDSRHSAWTPDELRTLARLFEGINDYDESARAWYSLYSLPNAADPDREESLAEITRLLLTAPEQPVQFGSGDLSLYRDIATLDPYPGFLNGILSLLLNSATPRSAYDTENRASAAYFHRARASELIRLFDTRFPKSEKRPELHALLIRTYATYGDNDGLLRAGREYLTAFPNAADRIGVATAMADAYARTEKTQQEFALYDELLKELAQRAEGVPIGNQPAAAQNQAAPARSPEYARILDRYISRLVSLKRLSGALALFRREIDRNPDDPGLYERLAAFLEQNKLDAEVEAVYRQAMTHFQEPSWSHKLARWYLRHKQNTQFELLTREVIKIFSGTQLESYIRDAAGQKLTPVLYRQVNLYAHQRFPNDLVFVNNLLTAYVQKGTANPVEYNALLRRYWYYDPALRERFFERLSSTRTLDAELAAIRTANPAELANTNPAAAQFVAEAESWRSHFEDAAPAFRAIAGLYPAANITGTRAASIYRSLATYDPPSELGNTRIASGIEQNLSKFDPRDHAALTRSGEIYADRELYARARPYWNKIAEIQPGNPEGYLEAATVFWDYFLFDDALRLLADGRRKLNDPVLYAYEAGAIHENRREYARAIEEYARGALAPVPNDQARQRLLALARRPRDRTRIDDLTARETAGPSPSIAAVSLRADVLAAQSRRPDLQQFLDGLATRAASLELAEWVERTASSNGFDKVQQRALEREVALSTDPVERIRKRLDLARFLEGRGDFQSAGRTLDALAKENPAILGVVRATVDFYWRNKQSKPAIDLLVASAVRSQPSYKTSFTYEAARKSADSGQYARSRAILDGLLQTSPYSAEYLTAYADTYAREGKDKDLRDFYTAKIKDLRAAPLDASERTEKTAALRRGLILVLTRIKDYTGAVDQYIEVINRYPEDDGLTREAAVYASTHGRAQQLSSYYAKTASESPKDYRWPMVEARIDTQLEDFPAAIAAWKRAIDVRPDRVDLYTSRAGLEERLLRFDEAATDYAKLYELNYHNGHWMEKVAEVRARQGKNDEAVAALRTALIEGRPQRPDIFFDMASRLESWNLLGPAREYAEKGVGLAGNNLFTEYATGARQYAHIMTRLRQHDAAWKRLLAIPHADEQAESALRSALAETGAMVAQYFTPEERSAFATFLAGGQAQPTVQRMESLLPVVAAAHLSDVESDWRYRILRSKPADAPDELVKLAQRRLRYAELGTRLEALWKAAPPDTENRDTRLLLAVNSYRLAGDPAAELRVLTQLDESAALLGEQIPRYAELLSQRAAQRLTTVAASDKQENVRDGIANYVLDHGAFPRALDVIAARGRGMPPVWTPAYTGLAGVWFAKPAPQVNAAFRDALGIATIGDRLGKPVDRDRHLAGDIWFYYGTSYGEYLSIAKEGDPDDYLPALLEFTPARSGAYFELAEIYRGSGQLPRAQEEYENALQLDATRADARDRLAGILWDRNQHDAAIAQWKAAVEALSTRQDRGRVPPDFWQTAQTTLEDIGKHNVLVSMRLETDRFLKNYVRRNGTWQVDPLLRGAMTASGSEAAGVAWILELARAAPDTPSFLSELLKRDWIPDAQRPAVYRALIDAAQVKLDAAYGDARASSESELRAWQIQWIDYLLEHKQTEQARKFLDAIPEQWRTAQSSQVVRLEVRLAAQFGTLAALLERYAQIPAGAPDAAVLRNAANELTQHGDKPDANRVLEYVYQRELDSRAFAASTFLGLAEIRLQQNDTASALALLRRMTQVAGEPFSNLVDAASLLETYKHPGEAVEFLETRVRAVPWDGEARMRLGRVRVAAGRERDRGVELLRAVAQSNDVAYDTRSSAARALGEAKAGPLTGTSAELILLASGTNAPADAEKPYFYDARMAAAKQTSDAAVRMRLLSGAAAIRPDAWEPKRDLFRAAFDAKRYQTAIAALSPLLADRPFTQALQQEAPPEQSSEGNAASDDEAGGRWYADQFLSGLGLEDAERAALARNLAQAYQALDRALPAAVVWRMARQLDPSDAVTKRQIEALQIREALARQNVLRRPVIKAALEQDHLVQPRLGGGQ